MADSWERLKQECGVCRGCALADRVPIGVTWWLLLAFTADAVCSLRFLAVTHDLEALRAVIWPVSADR